MSWLVSTFFRLHRRRGYTENGPQHIAYQDMVIMSDSILHLPKTLRDIFFNVIEETDNVVLEFLYQRQADKLEELKKSSGEGKGNGRTKTGIGSR